MLVPCFLIPNVSSTFHDIYIIFIKDSLSDRMPVPIGDFISKHVYDGKLQSNPLHPVHNRHACQFFDIGEGKEVADGKSWKVSLKLRFDLFLVKSNADCSLQNLAEVDAVVQIAQLLTSKERSFRVITPYDPQRNAMEQALREHGLEWENKCFNVDSFQGEFHSIYSSDYIEYYVFLLGNEEDDIIISLVRSARVGFLNDLRRTNVMLSRCKRAMYICSSRAFLKKAASQTLVGKMAKAWDQEGWVEWDELVEGKFKY